MNRYLLLFSKCVAYLPVCFLAIALTVKASELNPNPDVNLSNDDQSTSQISPTQKRSDKEETNDNDDDDLSLFEYDYEDNEEIIQKSSQGSDISYSVEYYAKGSFKVVYTVEEVNWVDPDHAENEKVSIDKLQKQYLNNALAVTIINHSEEEVISYSEVSQSDLDGDNKMVTREMEALKKLKNLGFRTINIYNDSPVEFRCLENRELICLGYFAELYGEEKGWVSFKGLQGGSQGIVNPTSYSLKELVEQLPNENTDQADNQNNDEDEDDDIKIEEDDSDPLSLRDRLVSILNWVNNIIDRKVYIADVQGFLNKKTGALIISDPTGVSDMPDDKTIPSELADDRDGKRADFPHVLTQMTVSRANNFKEDLQLLRTALQQKIEELDAVNNTEQANDNPAPKKKQKTKHIPPPAANQNTESAPDSAKPSDKQESQD